MESEKITAALCFDAFGLFTSDPTRHDGGREMRNHCQFNPDVST